MEELVAVSDEAAEPEDDRVNAPDAWPETAAVAAAAAVVREDEAAQAPVARRSWFRRGRAAAVAAAAGDAASQVERIEVGHTVEPQRIDVPWEDEPEVPSAGDPWEQGPESFGIELEPAAEPAPPAQRSDADDAPAVPRPLRRPQAVRSRRGRR